jgi:hypothetical protein
VFSPPVLKLLAFIAPMALLLVVVIFVLMKRKK